MRPRSRGVAGVIPASTPRKRVIFSGRPWSDSRNPGGGGWNDATGEVRDGCGDVDEGQTVVRRPGADGTVFAAVHLAVFELDAFPVRVVGAGQRGPGVVGARIDGLGEQRVAAVGADDEAGELCVLAAADAGRAAGLEQDLIDRESLADLGAGVAGGVHQDLVQDRAARAVERVDAFVFRPGALERDARLIEAHPARGGSAGGDHLVEQAPPFQSRAGGDLELVRGQRVRGEVGAVDDEDVQAGPGEQHRRGRARRPGSDDDRVVHAGSVPRVAAAHLFAYPGAKRVCGGGGPSGPPGRPDLRDDARDVVLDGADAEDQLRRDAAACNAGVPGASAIAASSAASARASSPSATFARATGSSAGTRSDGSRVPTRRRARSASATSPDVAAVAASSSRRMPSATSPPATSASPSSESSAIMPPSPRGTRARASPAIARALPGSCSISSAMFARTYASIPCASPSGSGSNSPRRAGLAPGTALQGGEALGRHAPILRRTQRRRPLPRPAPRAAPVYGVVVDNVNVSVLP